MGPAAGITAFFDEATNSVSYLVADPATGAAAVIDPVLDFDPASGRISTGSIDRILAAADEQKLRIAWVLETHVHADHLSGAAIIRERTGARSRSAPASTRCSSVFGPMLGVKDLDAERFRSLLRRRRPAAARRAEIEVIATPGHTPACVSYRIGDAVFVGDTLFMPDYGTARCDFPGGDAGQLYRSIQRLLALPRETRLFMCHDYKAPGRDAYAWETTVGEEVDRNVHIGGGMSERGVTSPCATPATRPCARRSCSIRRSR